MQSIPYVANENDHLSLYLIPETPSDAGSLSAIPYSSRLFQVLPFSWVPLLGFPVIQS